MARRVHEADPRAVVIAESGLNDPKVVSDWGCDGVWADDFHHALRVLLTGDREGYYAEFGTLEALAKTFRRPHFHDGTYSDFRRRRFGARIRLVHPPRHRGHEVLGVGVHDRVDRVQAQPVEVEVADPLLGALQRPLAHGVAGLSLIHI